MPFNDEFDINWIYRIFKGLWYYFLEKIINFVFLKWTDSV